MQGSRSYPIVLVVLLAGVVLSLLAGTWYEREERLRQEHAFLLITESHLRNIEHTLEHNREALTQLGLLYELSREFDRCAPWRAKRWRVVPVSD
ncbi:MAG: hypothetical protein ABW153_15800 [Sedimenticola sp.]